MQSQKLHCTIEITTGNCKTSGNKETLQKIVIRIVTLPFRHSVIALHASQREVVHCVAMVTLWSWFQPERQREERPSLKISSSCL